MKLPVYLYPNVFEVILDLDDNNNRVIQVMYQRDLKLQKGVKNKIQLQFKNSDQKLMNISSATFVASLFDTTNNRNLVQKNITIVDDGVTTSTRGLATLSFSESDLQSLDNTYYKLGFVALDSDGSYVPAYANTYYGMGATCEVRNDLYPSLQPSQQVLKRAFTYFFNADQSARWYEYYSGNLPANPQYKSNTALHTVAVYMSNYIGRVLIEGTLENSPTTFANYAVISDKSYNNFSGIDYTNFNGLFSKVRVRYIPAINPTTNENTGTSFAGSVDQVLYRS